jgi:6-phosphofructokinase 1
LLAGKLGVAAVEALLEGMSGVMVGEVNGKVAYTPFAETWQKRKSIDPEVFRLAGILAT